MSANGSESRIAASPLPYDHVIFTELDGLEGVLVDLNTKKYYQLNETASFIWRGLEKQLPVDRIANEMTERYDVNTEAALSSIQRALSHFASLKLVGSTHAKLKL